MPPIRVEDVTSFEAEPKLSDVLLEDYRSALNSISDSWDPLSHASLDNDKSVLAASRRSKRPSCPYPQNKVTSSATQQVAKKGRHSDASLGSQVKTITICGRTLHPTVAFDTLWRFAAERKAIDDRRRSGAPAPYVINFATLTRDSHLFRWTEDPILRKYSFCNTYRVLDKVCQYLIREVIEKGSQNPVEVVFRVILFNTFTRIETWELLTQELGPLTWAKYDRNLYEDVLSQAKEEGQSLYTGSFIKPAPHFGHADNYMNHLCLLEVLMENEVAYKLLGAQYLADVYEYLISFPSMGDFSTYQLMLSLSYCKLLNFHCNDFVIAGCGASSGLAKLFRKDDLVKGKAKVPNFEVEIIRWLTKTQNEHFKRLGLEFSGLGPKKLPMDVADMEHTVCEVDKYCRIAHPQLKGKRTEMRRNYEPSRTPYPTQPTLPKAWADPKRRTPHIRPDQILHIEKRYTVNRIADHRRGVNGTEYYVFWSGYSNKDASWEPEVSMMSDAPGAIKDYLASLVLAS